MRPDSQVPGLLWDALQFARNSQIAVGQTTLDRYLDGGPTAWATERQLELVGEALSKLRHADPEVAERIPEVHKIIGLRNILVHGYLIVNSRIVWLAATQQIPELIPVLEDLLGEVGSEASAT